MFKALEQHRAKHSRVFYGVLRMPVADELQTNINRSQVDQGVVLLGVHHMKGGVTRGLLTKDVRSAEGWQIGIDLFEYVQVKTQSSPRLYLHILSYDSMCTVYLSTKYFGANIEVVSNYGKK